MQTKNNQNQSKLEKNGMSFFSLIIMSFFTACFIITILSLIIRILPNFIPINIITNEKPEFYVKNLNVTQIAPIVIGAWNQAAMSKNHLNVRWDDYDIPKGAIPNQNSSVFEWTFDIASFSLPSEYLQNGYHKLELSLCNQTHTSSYKVSLITETTQKIQKDKQKPYSVEPSVYKSKIETVQAMTEQVTLTVHSNVNDDKVYINNKAYGSSKLDIRLRKGIYNVTVFKDGYIPFQQEIDLKTSQSVMANLKRNTSKLSGLFVFANPHDAAIDIINPHHVYSKGMNIKPGTYTIQATKKGYETQTISITIARKQIAILEMNLESVWAKQGSLGTVWKEPVTDMTFVWIPEGCYTMGMLEAEKNQLVNDIGQKILDKYYYDQFPAHEVCVDGFWLSQYEVTQKQWAVLINKNPSAFKGKDNPIENVKLSDINGFIKALKEKTQGTYRLPTEAEWEYACRGKNNQSCNPDQVGWIADNSQQTTHPVGLKTPNEFNLYDMIGNVWEWCLDTYSETAYSSHQLKNPVVDDALGKWRVVRGGSWLSLSTPMNCSLRFKLSDNYPYNFVGFRLVKME